MITRVLTSVVSTSVKNSYDHLVTIAVGLFTCTVYFFWFTICQSRCQRIWPLSYECILWLITNVVLLYFKTSKSERQKTKKVHKWISWELFRRHNYEGGSPVLLDCLAAPHRFESTEWLMYCFCCAKKLFQHKWTSQFIRPQSAV